MELKELQKQWNELGESDPLWAVLTDSTKKGGRWDVQDFFQTGRETVDAVIEHFSKCNIKLSQHRALDFGCAVGRLSQGLANHFEEVCGVDIAPSMIDLAKQYNQHGDKVKYFLNSKDDLSLFPDSHFEFIFSFITLQHIRPEYAQNYIKEFMRVLAPQGCLFFQLPDEPPSSEPTPLGKVKRQIKSVLPKPALDLIIKLRGEQLQSKMEMHGIKRENVLRLLEQNGAEIIDVEEIQEDAVWINNQYYIRKI